MNKIVLKQMGMNDRIIKAAGEYSGLYPGRVVSQYKDAYRVMTESAVLMAEVSGMKRRGPRIFPQWAILSCWTGRATRAAMPSSTMCSREKAP